MEPRKINDTTVYKRRTRPYNSKEKLDNYYFFFFFSDFPSFRLEYKMTLNVVSPDFPPYTLQRAL